MKKIFISYSNLEPDLTIAKEFQADLAKNGFEIFLATTTLLIGDDWAKRIEREINSFDFFIVLLSQNSKSSDMVLEEIKRAKRYYDRKPENNKPGILPIRINLPINVSINYDVDAYLSKFQQRIWTNSQDTQSILKEIVKVINNKESNENQNPQVINHTISKDEIPRPTPVANLEIPEGTVELNSPFYIERLNESVFIARILQDGALLRICAPRQSGKTSLLSRIIAFARERDHHVLSINFQLLDYSQIEDLDQLLIQICEMVAEKIEFHQDVLVKQLDYIWSNKFDRSKRKCDKFIEHVLKISDKPLVLALDEVDRLFKNEKISREFFGLLRAWNEQAKTPGKEIFKKLKLAVSYSTEALLAIKDINQSPFNTGSSFNLADFTKPEIIRLITAHRLSFSDDEIFELMDMIGGQPFLVRKALFSIANNEINLTDLLKECYVDGGLFDDVLRRQFWAISRKDNLLYILRDIINNNHLSDIDAYIRLKAFGIIIGEIPNVQMKYKIYKKYFSNKVN